MRSIKTSEQAKQRKAKQARVHQEQSSSCKVIAQTKTVLSKSVRHLAEPFSRD